MLSFGILNISKVDYLVHSEGAVHMILEYMNCGSLEDIIQTCGKIPEVVIAHIAEQVDQFFTFC